MSPTAVNRECASRVSPTAMRQKRLTIEAKRPYNVSVSRVSPIAMNKETLKRECVSRVSPTATNCISPVAIKRHVININHVVPHSECVKRSFLPPPLPSARAYPSPKRAMATAARRASAPVLPLPRLALAAVAAPKPAGRGRRGPAHHYLS